MFIFTPIFSADLSFRILVIGEFFCARVPPSHSLAVKLDLMFLPDSLQINHP